MMGDPLTFRQLRIINRGRAQRWHPGFPDDDAWSGADWANALAGEVGEACNVVKKMRRNECGIVAFGAPTDIELRGMLAEELADVLLYCDLLAARYRINLADAVRDKFNETSLRYDFPERL